MITQGLKNSTVGIFGLGNIGMAIAKRLVGFEVKKIVYTNRKINTEAEKLGFEYVKFDDMLSQSDFIICSCSLNSESEQIFNKSAFDKMKKSAIFINVGRGLCVNQDDLYDALKDGKIYAAGLDVTTPPTMLPVDHKLYSLSNCFITPYIGWCEKANVDQRLALCVQNVLNFFDKKELMNEFK